MISNAKYIVLFVLILLVVTQVSAEWEFVENLRVKGEYYPQSLFLKEMVHYGPYLYAFTYWLSDTQLGFYNIIAGEYPVLEDVLLLEDFVDALVVREFLIILYKHHEYHDIVRIYNLEESGMPLVEVNDLGSERIFSDPLFAKAHNNEFYILTSENGIRGFNIYRLTPMQPLFDGLSHLVSFDFVGEYLIVLHENAGIRSFTMTPEDFCDYLDEDVFSDGEDLEVIGNTAIALRGQQRLSVLSVDADGQLISEEQHDFELQIRDLESLDSRLLLHTSSYDSALMIYEVTQNHELVLQQIVPKENTARGFHATEDYVYGMSHFNGFRVYDREDFNPEQVISEKVDVSTHSTPYYEDPFIYVPDFSMGLMTFAYEDGELLYLNRTPISEGRLSSGLRSHYVRQGEYLLLLDELLLYGNIKVFDLSIPHAPEFVTSYSLNTSYLEASHKIGDTLIVFGQSYYYMLDISDPTSISEISMNDYSDYLESDRVYGAATNEEMIVLKLNNGNTVIVSVNEAGELNQESSFNHVGSEISLDGHYVTCWSTSHTEEGVQVFDCSNLDDIELIYDSGLFAHDCFMRDGKVYTAKYNHRGNDSYVVLRYDSIDGAGGDGISGFGVGDCYVYMSSSPNLITPLGEDYFILSDDEGLRILQATLLLDSPEPSVVLPAGVKLCKVFPNPFNASTTVQYSLGISGPARLAVFDVLGRHVKTLHDEYTGAGEHQISFDASSLASGQYFLQLKTGEAQTVRRITVVK